MIRFDQRFLAGLTQGGLVVVGPDREAEIALAGSVDDRLRILRALARGAGPDPLAQAGLTPADAQRLFEALDELGTLVEEERDLSDEASLSALLADPTVDGGFFTATHEELLLVPPGLPPGAARRALRAFVAGFSGRGRLAAYGFAASLRRETAIGDLPEREVLEEALASAEARAEGREAVTVDLRDGAVRFHPPDELLSRWDRPHRLGPVLTVASHAVGGAGAPLFHAMSEYACPNLRFAEHHEGECQAVAASEAMAVRIACAEGAERFAAGDASPHELRRASLSDIGSPAIAGDSILAFGDRAYEEGRFERFDPEAEYLWVEAATLSGELRWVPADYVFYPWVDPAAPTRRLALTNSSGVAAHPDREVALESAATELVERDAFLWTWAQKVSRARIHLDNLEAPERVLAEGLRSRGWRIHLIDITLDLGTVVLSVAERPSSLVLGAGCSHDPARAITKALHELAPLELGEPRGLPDLAVDEVGSPREHGRLYVESDLAAAASFLFASNEFVEPAAASEPIAVELEERGQLAAVDFASPAAEGLHVVRAIAPGLAPLTFGYDCEPWGMQRLLRPVLCSDGVERGRVLAEPEKPLQPHPFA